jgi:hypothetical protein
MVDNPFATVSQKCSTPALYCFFGQRPLSHLVVGRFFNDDTNFQSPEDQDVLVGLIWEPTPANRNQVNVFIDLTRIAEKLRAIDQKPYLKLVPHLLRTDTKWITPKECFFDCLGFQPSRLRSTTKPRLSRMANLFCLHTMTLGTESLKGCHAFPATLCTLAPTAARRVWNGIQTLRAELWHLGEYSEKQGSFTECHPMLWLERLALSASVGRIRLQLIEWHSLQRFRLRYAPSVDTNSR